MEGVSPIYKWTKPLNYEFISEKFNKARILVYADVFEENDFKIMAKDKYLLIMGYDTITDQTYYLKIKLWFKIKKVDATLKNGILTINVKGRRFFIF